MKKLFLTLALALLLFSCNNDDMETNPYPDGVYPFEVSNVSHTVVERFNYTITWATPTDGGFSKVSVKLIGIMGDMDHTEYEIYPNPEINDPAYKFNLQKNSFYVRNYFSGDYYVIIKCVDKFGNVSNGVKYEFSTASD